MASPAPHPFGDFTEAQYAELTSLGSRMERPSGQLLIAQGETTDHVLLILSGHVKVEFSGVNRTLEIFGPGEVIGDNAILLGPPRTADVTTLTPVAALLVPGQEWTGFLMRHPSAMFRQLVHSRRTLLIANRRQTTDRYGAERRLALALRDLAARDIWPPADGNAVIRLKQEELAGFSGLKRDSVVKVFRSFKAAGLIDVGRGTITVLDPERLGSVAKGAMTTVAMNQAS